MTPAATPTVTTRTFYPGAEPQSADAAAPGAVLWVDVDRTADPAQVAERLGRLGLPVEQHHVADLLTRDNLPRAEVCAGFRHVSVVGLAMEEDTGRVADLRFDMVEVLAGPDWLVTCWQHGTPDAAPEVVAALRDAVSAEVTDFWRSQDLRTAGDLATAHVESLTRRYRGVVRSIEDRLGEWEIDFHADRADATQLKPMLGMVLEARRRLAALNANRSVAADGRWFEADREDLDRRANHQLDRTLERLALLGDAIRADLELVALEQMARQAEAAQQSAAAAKLSAEADEEFNKKLGAVTAFLLVPTLIAGVFGANTALPGGGTWTGFVAMVALMVLTGTGVWWWLVLRRSRSA